MKFSFRAIRYCHHAETGIQWLQMNFERKTANSRKGESMKVLAMLGSPHEEGPSSVIAREVLRGAKDAGHEVVVYNRNDMLIKDCQGCGACKRAVTDCVVNDDLKPYWKELRECGALIVSSPIYAGQVTGGMITYMNRHYCLLDKDWNVTIEPGKKLIGVFSQGMNNPDEYLPAIKWFLGDFENRKFELQDILVHTGDMSYDADSEIMKRAYELG